MKSLIARRCDFQVHSPRDAGYRDWDPDKMTLEGLREWATKLLEEAPKRGVTCLAVTDHHDLWPALIALEAQYKLGSPVWVLPGMEVTSSEGLQAILLFDPILFGGAATFALDTCEGTLNRITTALGQSISVDTNSATILRATPFADLVSLSKRKPEERRPVFVKGSIDRLDRSLVGPNGITDNLDRVCKDKYVLLPNLEKNKHGIFQNPSGRTLYLKAEGWFFGGIVGGGNPTEKDVLQGKRAADWGRRVVTCLQTSDQKGKDRTNWFSDRLGAPDCATWLKLSEPSAVSVAQAMISGEARRAYDYQPKQPADRIERIEISGVEVFGPAPLVLPFVPELNTIIGGRGTGKSLVLSALMRVFGSDSDWLAKPTESLLPWERRHLALFADGGPLCGPKTCISVEFVRESSTRYRLILDAIGDDLLEDIRLEMQADTGWSVVAKGDAVRLALDFKPQFFLQGQMSAITGSSADQVDLTRLIEGPIREKRSALRQKLQDLGEVVKDGFAQKKKLEELKERAAAIEAQRKQKEAERAGFLEIAKKGLSEDQQKLFTESEKLRVGNDAAGRLAEGVEETAEQLTHLAADLDVKRTAEKVLIDTLAQSSTLGESSKKYLESLYDLSVEVAADLKILIRKISKKRSELKPSAGEFEKEIGKLISTSSELIEKEKARREALKKSEQLQKDLAELRKRTEQASAEMQQIERSGKVKKATEALEEFQRVVREYSAALIERAESISNDKGSRLLVRIVPGGRYENFLQYLKNLCQGASIREKTWLELEGILSKSANSASIISDLLRDALESKSQTGTPGLPLQWAACGFSEKGFANVIERTSMEDWLTLSAVLADDRVDVSYKKGGGKKPISILNASPGERAVELLKLSLSSTSGPIVIDQPEDDLDNHFLAEQLVDLVQFAKHQNQLIFASHNANLVVHGDSEEIHVMITQDLGGGRSGCGVKESGTIDQVGVCESIELVMEGGPLAFEHRRRKYHETLER